jgi:ATP-dependent Lon protease
VLPVGGIKDKVLAARRAGIRTVLLPARNEKDYDDIPEDAKKAMRFVWIADIDQALREALGLRDLRLRGASEGAPASERLSASAEKSGQRS